MLTELRISNFAIIDEQSVHFGEGLNVISGETGSGKSIILNALELILGARPRTHFIREGSDQLEVEGHFDLTRIGPSILGELPHIAHGDELVVCRSMNRAGKGKVYINGRIGTVSLLEEIAQKLINICGQGQQMRLLNPSFHLGLVDEYAGNDKLLDSYRAAYRLHKDIEARISEIEERRKFSDRRQIELEDIVAELSAYPLRTGIRGELEARVKKLDGAEKLIEGVQNILSGIADESGVLSQFSSLNSKLHELTRWDNGLQAQARHLHDLRMSVQELEGDLMRYLNGIDLDHAHLEDLRNELAGIARLERKYRSDDAGLVSILDEARQELADLAAPQSQTKLLAELEQAAANLQVCADRLTDSRNKAGDRLMKAVQADLRDVNMSDAKLKLEVEPADLGVDGADSMEFLISSNKGELYKPLRQIASGGELSRIMLVLKKNLRDKSGVNVLVFDEVDTGISGAVARAVGEKVKSLSRLSQVICITHLAQIASLADRHILVDKKVGARAVSKIRILKEEEKVDEIARMLAGYQITKATRESARELLSSNK